MSNSIQQELSTPKELKVEFAMTDSIQIFAKVYTSYTRVLDLIKTATVNIVNAKTLTSQETLCLIQIHGYHQQKHGGENNINNLAKRTNNVPEHLMFQLNNLARKGMVNLSSKEINLTQQAHDILQNISRLLPKKDLEIMDQNITSLNEVISNLLKKLG